MTSKLSLAKGKFSPDATAKLISVSLTVAISLAVTTLTGDKSNAVTLAPLFASSTAIFPEPQPNSRSCLPSRSPKNSEIPGSSLFSAAYRWKSSPGGRISKSPNLFRAISSHFDFSLLYLSSNDMDYCSCKVPAFDLFDQHFGMAQ